MAPARLEVLGLVQLRQPLLALLVAQLDGARAARRLRRRLALRVVPAALRAACPDQLLEALRHLLGDDGRGHLRVLEVQRHLQRAVHRPVARADLRAGERTYQLLHQLGGRAGRGELAGTVLVQTFEPEHAVMKALVAHDRDRLMALEARERKAGGWPPFGQLAAILLDGVDEAKVRAAGQMLARTAPADERLRILGPAPAPLSKLRGQSRYRLLVKAKAGIHLQRTLKGWLKDQKFSGVRIKVDVNPYYFM